MGFLEHIFGYSNIDSAIERATKLKYKSQVSVEELRELLNTVEQYMNSRSEWANEIGIPGGHAKISTYSQYSIMKIREQLELAILASEAMEEEYTGNVAELFLDEINPTKQDMF